MVPHINDTLIRPIDILHRIRNNQEIIIDKPEDTLFIQNISNFPNIFYLSLLFYFEMDKKMDNFAEKCFNFVDYCLRLLFYWDVDDDLGFGIV